MTSDITTYLPAKLLEEYRERGTAETVLEKVLELFSQVISGQADAARLAIAKSLVEYSKGDKLRKIFLEYDRQLLVADVRQAETSKPNVSKPRKKRQKSYR